CRELLECEQAGRVDVIQGNLSDPHNGGRSVRILQFEDGARVVYKPKDLRVDVAWHDLVADLNEAGRPVGLKAGRTIARQKNGWAEFIAHTGCADAQACGRFFRRAGAWLALFYCFCGSDMHQENVIADADHPVPIDLEMVLRADSDEVRSGEPDAEAF